MRRRFALVTGVLPKADGTLPGLELEASAAKNKYRARKTVGLGPTGTPRVYDSRAEALFGAELNRRKSLGMIVSWVPQPSLECGTDEAGRAVRYRADALIVQHVNDDGTFVGRFIDKKGADTPTSRAKRAALRNLYGIDVEVVGS